MARFASLCDSVILNPTYQTRTAFDNRLFYYLEHIGFLDPMNEMHIYALHYVFLPRLRKAQEEFREAWNSHSIRTARNRTPEQLYTEGALILQKSGLTALDFFSRIDGNYGYEEEGIAGRSSSCLVSVTLCYAVC